ncbi:helix-turn-helix domain-containing protein [Streptomyces luteolus]|uniref:helix-turn-helix domain-containing protein n=1 Tax=Streptomyces luteolus TaxID=3043615 RepID=UPI0038CFCDDD
MEWLAGVPYAQAVGAARRHRAANRSSCRDRKQRKGGIKFRLRIFPCLACSCPGCRCLSSLIASHKLVGFWEWRNVGYGRAMISADVLRLVQVRVKASTGAARLVRMNARLSLAEVAELCGVGASTVWRWEQGKRVPRGEPALRYAQILEALALTHAAQGEEPC